MSKTYLDAQFPFESRLYTYYLMPMKSYLSKGTYLEVRGKEAKLWQNYVNHSLLCPKPKHLTTRQLYQFFNGGEQLNWREYDCLTEEFVEDTMTLRELIRRIYPRRQTRSAPTA